MNSLKKSVLIVLDGWGYRAEKKGNAIAQALTPNYSRYLGEYPNGLIQASSLFVGLPQDVMGNSEVGHMNIGGGRRILQDQVRINESISTGAFSSIPALQDIAKRLRTAKTRVHLVGLVSSGNVHSSEGHYRALLQFFQHEGVSSNQILFHAITDGRDTPPKSAKGFLQNLQAAIDAFGGRIATVSGRFYSMDRDMRWERTDLGYRAIVLGKGKKAESAQAALDAAYAEGETDEFMSPYVIGASSEGMKNDDIVLCFNFRADRMRQLVRALIDPATPLPSLNQALAVTCVTFTEYDASFGLRTIFSPQTYSDTLGECLERAKLCQFRTAETEKYAHVTYFFNCGRENPYAGEERRLVPSPKVKTYDLQPEMSSSDVTKGLVERIHAGHDALMVVNFAQPDMVGHTGNFDAAVAAVEATDRCLGEIVTAAMDHGTSVVLTADHGNIEMMIDPVTGEAHTAHTLNPVPVLCIGEGMKKFRVRPKGALCDIAPTLLKILNLPKPQAMTGESLLVET